MCMTIIIYAINKSCFWWHAWYKYVLCKLTELIPGNKSVRWVYLMSEHFDYLWKLVRYASPIKKQMMIEK